MVEPVIRPATEADARTIAEIHVAGWVAAYRGMVPDELLASLSVDDRESMWRRAAGREDQTLLVAERAGGTVGFVSAGPTGDQDVHDATGEIYAIYVQPGHVGTGAGRALLSRAVEALRARGFRRATLWVLDANERGRSFYEAAGWRPDGASKVEDWNGFPLREVRYETDIT